MLFEHLKERKEILVVVFLNYWFGMLWFVIYFVFEKLKVFGVENMDRKLWGFQNWSEENIYKCTHCHEKRYNGSKKWRQQQQQ